MVKRIINNNVFKGIVSAVFWIGIWWILSAFVGKSIILPSPYQTVKTLFVLVAEGNFWVSCLYTVGRIMLGFILGVAIGTLGGIVNYKSNNARVLLKPLLTVIKTTPVASLILISLFWLDKNDIPSFISCLIVTPIVWSSVSSSLNSCDLKLIEAANVFSLSPLKRAKYIYIPSIKKDYIAVLETGLGIAWKSGVAAEVLVYPNDSIGKELHTAKINLESENMFAWTLSIIIISFALEILLKKLLSQLLKAKRRNGR